MEQNNSKILSAMTEEEKKKLRNQRFNLVSDNVNTIESIQVLQSIYIQSIEKERKKNEERLKRFGTYGDEDKIKMRKERFGTNNEIQANDDKLKKRKERFGEINETLVYFL